MRAEPGPEVGRAWRNRERGGNFTRPTRSALAMPILLRSPLTLVALACASTAVAGELYRCKDKQGITAFTSTRAGYSQCKLVGNFPAAPKAPPAQSVATAAKAPAVGNAPAPGARVEFRTAAGTAEPKAVPAAGGARPKVQRGAVYKYTKNGV